MKGAKTMKKIEKFKNALADIKTVRKMIKGLTFDDARVVLCGFNCFDGMFDYNFGCITGTITNKNGMAKMSKDTCFDVYDKTFLETGLVDHLTEKEMKGA